MKTVREHFKYGAQHSHQALREVLHPQSPREGIASVCKQSPWAMVSQSQLCSEECTVSHSAYLGCWSCGGLVSRGCCAWCLEKKRMSSIADVGRGISLETKDTPEFVSLKGLGEH